MGYKPTKEDYDYARGIYDNLVKYQTYKPSEVMTAYERLYGEPAANQLYARSKIFTHFQYMQKEAINQLEEVFGIKTDKDDNVDVKQENIDDLEDINSIDEDNTSEDIIHEERYEPLTELEKLNAEYTLAKLEKNVNKQRSVKMKINALKKKENE